MTTESRSGATVEEAERRAAAIQNAYLDAVRICNRVGMLDLEALARKTLLGQESDATAFVMYGGIWGFYNGKGNRMAPGHKAFKAVAKFMDIVDGTLPGFTGNAIRLDLVNGDIIKRKEW